MNNVSSFLKFPIVCLFWLYYFDDLQYMLQHMYVEQYSHGKYSSVTF